MLQKKNIEITILHKGRKKSLICEGRIINDYFALTRPFYMNNGEVSLNLRDRN